MDVLSILKELDRRLADFKHQVSAKSEEVTGAGPLPRHLNERVSDLHTRTDAARRKIQAAEPSALEATKQELESEWQALTHDFEQWLEHVDEHYRR